MTPCPPSLERRHVVRNGAPVDTVTDASAALVRRYFDMWNTGQGSMADELLGPDYFEHAHPNFLGPAASRALVPRLHGLYPGMVVSAEVVLANAEFVVVRTSVEPGDLDGHPDGPRRGMAMFRIVGGKLAEQWSWYEPVGR
jgi:hypothetical protein